MSPDRGKYLGLDQALERRVVRGVGARILGAVSASVAATGLNTNLGIVLLTVPLAAAADARGGTDDLRERLGSVLEGLDRSDADQAYQAIAIANPAGLGAVEDGDVAAPPSITLREAMSLAADRDRIARAYVTDYDDIFSFALPALRAARRTAATESLAITALHMSLLASFPDSHIARKYSADAAEAVRAEAVRLTPFWSPSPCPESWQPLLDFDASLKARGLNPGTTADFVVTTVFADMLTRGTATKRTS